MNQQCARFRRSFSLFSSSLLDDTPLLKKFIEKAKKCCEGCRFFLSSRLAIQAAIRVEEELTYFNGEENCLIAVVSSKLLEMSFDAVERTREFGISISLESHFFRVDQLDEETSATLVRWTRHELECQQCATSYARLLKAAEEFQEKYSLAIETGGEILPPPNSVRNIPKAAHIM